MLLVICLVLLLWLAASYWRMQEALRWWFRQEAIDRTAQTDQIQNGLIQDLFAMQLCLQALPNPTETDARELNPVEAVNPQQHTCLAKIEQMHQHLTDLSIALTRPYLAESLPLALRSVLQQWQTGHPHCQLQLELPPDWSNGSAECNRMVVATLEMLLKLALPSESDAAMLRIKLSNHSQTATLSVKITYPDQSVRITATRAVELNYLCRCFRCLMPGQCSYHTHLAEATWQFKWNNNCNLKPVFGEL